MSTSIDLRTLADGGMWIADDRVYAFVGAHGIHTVGWHGLQPVSRNSRILHSDTGAITLRLRTDASEAWHDVIVDDIEWDAASVSWSVPVRGGALQFSMRALGTRMLIMISSDRAESCACELRLHSVARVTNVQGERTWSPFTMLTDETIAASFRDRILLDAWMERSGPYAGDFLIPEPVRRTIFARRCRSGEAAREDLRPEYRNVPLPLYDATEHLSLTADHGICALDGDDAIARFELGGHAQPRAELVLAFSSTGAVAPPDAPGTKKVVEPHTQHCSLATPLPLGEGPGERAAQSEKQSEFRPLHPAPSAQRASLPSGVITDFLAHAPALVASCLVRDLGMLRACTGSYYWIWAWDALVSAGAAFRWGDTALPAAVVRFVNTHRDADGRIPARWTRDLQPLDTPDRGAIEALLCVLTEQCVAHADDRALLDETWPRFVAHFEHIAEISDERGLFPTRGFYPDLLSAFGRTAHTAVAMETGMHFVFCRTLAELARMRGETALAAQADDHAMRIRVHFLDTFFVRQRGFLTDARDMRTGAITDSYPIFSLLFLCSPHGMKLVEPVMDRLADFITAHHLTAHGFRTVPAWDRNARSESVMNAWYPHWDKYAIALLHAAGRTDAIEHWSRCVEETLAHLGGCPEFLVMDGFDAHDPASWRRHGAMSQLNGLTAWCDALHDHASVIIAGSGPSHADGSKETNT